MIEMKVNGDSSEIVHYDIPGLPVKILREKLSDYPGMRAICHWHDDIEMIYILSGRMHYEINGRTVLLTEESVLFVNARQLHYGFSVEREECLFICVLFHPSLLNVTEKLYHSQVLPVTRSDALEYLLFEPEAAGSRRIASCLRSLSGIRDNDAAGVQWKIAGCIYDIWG